MELVSKRTVAVSRDCNVAIKGFAREGSSVIGRRREGSSELVAQFANKIKTLPHWLRIVQYKAGHHFDAR